MEVRQTVAYATVSRAMHGSHLKQALLLRQLVIVAAQPETPILDSLFHTRCNQVGITHRQTKRQTESDSGRQSSKCYRQGANKRKWRVKTMRGVCTEFSRQSRYQETDGGMQSTEPSGCLQKGGCCSSRGTGGRSCHQAPTWSTAAVQSHPRGMPAPCRA